MRDRPGKEAVEKSFCIDPDTLLGAPALSVSPPPVPWTEVTLSQTSVPLQSTLGASPTRAVVTNMSETAIVMSSPVQVCCSKLEVARGVCELNRSVGICLATTLFRHLFCKM
jgi:hypothetical protein